MIRLRVPVPHGWRLGISALFALSLTAALSVPHTARGDAAETEPVFDPVALDIADRIEVRKGARKLLLMRGGKVMKSYDVSLGLNPEGHKEQEGDFRTPEGSYHLSRFNAYSKFFLSIQISYPNAGDRAHARRMGVNPGGQIMIHGLPNEPSWPESHYNRNDWTDGCIAVSNSDMVEIWLMTALDTPVEILP